MVGSWTIHYRREIIRIIFPHLEGGNNPIPSSTKSTLAVGGRSHYLTPRQTLDFKIGMSEPSLLDIIDKWEGGLSWTEMSYKSIPLEIDPGPPGKENKVEKIIKV